MELVSAPVGASPAVGPNAYLIDLKAVGSWKEASVAVHASNDVRADRVFRRARHDRRRAMAALAVSDLETGAVCILPSIHGFNALIQVGHAGSHGNFPQTDGLVVVSEQSAALPP